MFNFPAKFDITKFKTKARKNYQKICREINGSLKTSIFRSAKSSFDFSRHHISAADFHVKLVRIGEEGGREHLTRHRERVTS
jgi:hypothetical protein